MKQILSLILAALMLKTTVHYFSERKDPHVPENIDIYDQYGYERQKEYVDDLGTELSPLNLHPDTSLYFPS